MLKKVDNCLLAHMLSTSDRNSLLIELYKYYGWISWTNGSSLVDDCTDDTCIVSRYKLSYAFILTCIISSVFTLRVILLTCVTAVLRCRCSRNGLFTELARCESPV